MERKMEMQNLKRCPFCGGEAVYSTEESDAPFSTMCHFVTCSNNCLEGLYASGDTKEEAIKAWNNRPSPWHTGTPTEKGDYLCAFEMFDESLEYGWCQWDGNAWEVLCDYDPNINEMVAWRKFEPYKEKTK